MQLNSAWDALNKAWKERDDKLEEAMQAAVQYQDGLQVRLFLWGEGRIAVVFKYCIGES